MARPLDGLASQSYCRRLELQMPALTEPNSMADPAGAELQMPALTEPNSMADPAGAELHVPALKSQKEVEEILARIRSSPPSRTPGSKRGNVAVWYPSK